MFFVYLLFYGIILLVYPIGKWSTEKCFLSDVRHGLRSVPEKEHSGHS